MSIAETNFKSLQLLVRVNAKIPNLCKEKNYDFIDHSNVNSSHLYEDGLHLLESPYKHTTFMLDRF